MRPFRFAIPLMLGLAATAAPLAATAQGSTQESTSGVDSHNRALTGPVPPDNVTKPQRETASPGENTKTQYPPPPAHAQPPDPGRSATQSGAVQPQPAPQAAPQAYRAPGKGAARLPHSAPVAWFWI